MKRTRKVQVLVAATAIALFAGSTAKATFTVGLDGVHGQWNSVYVQGFSPSVEPMADPGLLPGHPVKLKEFSFFKSGNADVVADIRLAILDNIFADIQGMNLSSPYVVGLSDNTITDTSTIATGDPITFDFSSLPDLSYDGEYAAAYVTLDVGTGDLTPIVVPSMTVNYYEDLPDNPGVYLPEANYGGDSVYIYATSNFIDVTPLPLPGTKYFHTFDAATDADFLATFQVVPEPTTTVLGLLGAAWVIATRSRQRSLLCR